MTNEINETEYKLLKKPVSSGAHVIAFEHEITFIEKCAITLRFSFGGGTADDIFGNNIVTDGKLIMTGMSEPLLNPFDIKALPIIDVFKYLTWKIATR